MKRTKHINLDITNPKSIEKTIKYFEEMRDSFPRKVEQLCTELADIGIRIAIAQSGGSELASYVLFSKEIKSKSDDGCEVIMFGRNITHVFGEGVNAAEINPILMMEYGSGWIGSPTKTIGLDTQIEVGQGTFPGQTHAFDEQGWFYRDKNGVLHRSYGEEAYYPMQNAYDYMQTQVDEVIARVFQI